MAQVSYALREDPNSIFLLQDAGKRYDKYCQITAFGRNLVRPEFFQQYLYFAPFSSNKGKYQGNATNIQMSIEDNGYEPMRDYVAVIESEVEFKIVPTAIRQLSKEFMPAWGVKSYLDYYSDKKSGILLFLRVYKVNQPVSPLYLEKGARGSSQILRLYNEGGEEITLPIDGMEPVISDNKFSYLKDEILHMLKVEGAFIAQYDSTEKGLSSLQDRVEADRQVHGTQLWWKNRHVQWLDNDYSEDDGFDTAQLDYDAIYDEVLRICPGMRNMIGYIRNIQAARLGEYDYYLQDVHNHTEREKEARNRIFEMSLRTAVKNALYQHNESGIDLEDAFQESCIGIMTAIDKHHDDISSLFPSYSSMWMRQTVSRSIASSGHNLRVPVHYEERIKQIFQQLTGIINERDVEGIDTGEFYDLLLSHTDCGNKEAFRFLYILAPYVNIEEAMDNPEKEIYFIDENDAIAKVIDNASNKSLKEAMDILRDRERQVLIYRFGMDGDPEMSLEEVGTIMNITRERVRQIEAKAKLKIVTHYYRKHLITKKQFDSVVECDEQGIIGLKTNKNQYTVKRKRKKTK